MKIALGTAQFGLKYGAFNDSGQLSQDAVLEVLHQARLSGVDTLDTAAAYGVSESVLGRAGVSGFDVVSKCPALKGERQPSGRLQQCFEESTLALALDALYGYLLHDADDLFGESADEIWGALEQLKSQRRVKKIGVSVYSLDEARTLANRYPLDIVQLPANVLDPWFQSPGLGDEIEIHARSAFLQGFLLSAPDRLPEKFSRWRGVAEQFNQRCEQDGLSRLQAALLPLINTSQIARVVVGVDGVKQLREILQAVSTADGKSFDLKPIDGVDQVLLDPRRW